MVPNNDTTNNSNTCYKAIGVGIIIDTTTNTTTNEQFRFIYHWNTIVLLTMIKKKVDNRRDVEV